MSVIITYIAKVGTELMPTHTVGAQYQITTAFNTLTAPPAKQIRHDIKSISGRMVSIHHRSERSISFSYNKVKEVDIDQIREFIDSTRLGSATPFSIDALSVPWIGEDLTNLVMTNTPELIKKGTSAFYNFSFKCYRQPA